MSAATESQAKRKPGRPKGSRASEKQKATAPQARAKAAQAKKERAAARALEVPRWKQLEQGDITVKDLTDQELIRGECANNDGTWEGKRHRLAPAMVNKMRTEYKRRFQQGMEELGPLVLETMEDILNDDEARPQQVAIVKMVTEYTVGKVPDVVHVGPENEWDRLQSSGFRIERGEAAVTVNNEGHEVVPGEVEEQTA